MAARASPANMASSDSKAKWVTRSETASHHHALARLALDILICVTSWGLVRLPFGPSRGGLLLLVR